MKKAVVLVVVMGVLIVLSILALAALYLMTNEARVAEHKIRRMRAMFTAQGGIIHALERLRREGTGNLGNINSNDPSLNGLTADITVRQRGATTTDPCPSSAPSDFCVEVRVNY